MNDIVSNDLFVHRHFINLDDKTFMYDIKFVLSEDGFFDFRHIGIHTVLEDSRLSPCINKDPHIITEEMYASAFDILIKDGVMKPHE